MLFRSDTTPAKTTAEWVALCEEAEIPCMPVIDVDDLADDEHLKAVSMFHHMEHPSEGPTVVVRSSLNFEKTPNSIRRHAPRFGEHGREILAELGYGAEEITAMEEAGALIPDDSGMGGPT